jgi:L-asparaginase II
MNNPVLIEVLRGTVVESRHTGAVVAVDADGREVLALGDVQRPVFPRSAIKAIQALPLVESGAADGYGFGPEELALACSSHSGEPGHVAVVERMLTRLGLDDGALRCGVHWPIHQPSAQALARAGGAATAVHNNCSGKHAGFLCIACSTGADPVRYVQSTHPVQRMVRDTLEVLSQSPLLPAVCAIDGCSVPTWALPLDGLALAFARFGTGAHMLPERARAAARLREACTAHPWHAAGTGRFCTEVMQKFGARIFLKTGAEGVYCAALLELGIGIAVKCDDGAGRAAEAMMAAALDRLLNNDADSATLEPFVRPAIRNWNGIVVGGLRPTEAFKP